MPRLPEVSVVIPARNAEATILRAIDSVGPGGGDCEVLVVNDGSTDDSAALLDDAALRRPWLRVLHTPHRGIVAALNMGIAHARAELIARLDADDEALPGRIDLQRTFLHDNPEIGLVGGLVEFAGDAHSARGYALHVEWTNSVRSEEEIFLLRFVESPFPHPSVMFRRCLIERHGGYIEGDLPEDYELWLRWMDAGVRMAKIAVPVLRWHDSAGRLSRSDARYRAEAFYAVKARYAAAWLRRHSAHWPQVIVWGAGRITRQRAAMLRQHGARIEAWVDIDPKRIGARIDGVPVLSPEQLPAPSRCFVLPFVGSRGARERIVDWLERHGYHCGESYLPMA